MTLMIKIPEELERDLTSEAAVLGLPLSVYVVRLLTTRTTIATMPQTGPELVAYWRKANLIGNRPDIADS